MRFAEKVTAGGDTKELALQTWGQALLTKGTACANAQGQNTMGCHEEPVGREVPQQKGWQEQGQRPGRVGLHPTGTGVLRLWGGRDVVWPVL